MDPEFTVASFATVSDGLDYAARGQSGFNFFSGREKLETALSYAELRDRSVALAQRFSRAGLPRGSRVAIIADTSPDFVTFFLGCQYAGMIPVPLPLTSNFGGREAYTARLEIMIEKSGATVIVGPSEIVRFLKGPGNGSKMIGTPEEFYALPSEGGQLRPFTPEEPCYIQYSSGSTSLPRGVLVSQKAVLNNARGIGRHGLQLRPGDRSTSWLPLYHDMGLVGFCLTPMLSQVTVDMLATQSFALRPLTWLKLISEHGSSVSFSPTFGYELCARRGLNGSANSIDLSTWRIAGIGGEMVRPETLNRFSEVFASVGFSRSAFLPSYGLAESTLAVTFSALGDGVSVDRIDKQHLARTGNVIATKRNGSDRIGAARSFVVCGAPLPDHDVEIRDDGDNRLPDQQVGRICVRGPSVMDGYFNDPSATSEAMTRDGWLDTGDLGYMIEGQLVVTGRRKDLVIVNGLNIWPQDVEWAVERIDGVRPGDVACFSIEGPDSQEHMIVVLQCRVKGDAERDDLRKRAAASVRESSGADCEVVLVPPKSLTFTSSGKLSRSAVRDRYLAGALPDLDSAGLTQARPSDLPSHRNVRHSASRAAREAASQAQAD